MGHAPVGEWVRALFVGGWEGEREPGNGWGVRRLLNGRVLLCLSNVSPGRHWRGPFSRRGWYSCARGQVVYRRRRMRRNAIFFPPHVLGGQKKQCR